jgi:thymidylate synthase ThyX
MYHRLYARLRPHVLAKYPDLAREPGNQTVLDGWAKEDARYIVSLATEGQLGMTVNARNLELLIRRFAAKELTEIRELNQRIYALAKDVAPSIVLFTDPTPFDARTYAEVGEEAARSGPPAGRRGTGGRPRRTPDVRLVDATPAADLQVLAALLHTVTGRPYGDVLEEARRLPPARKKALFKAALRRMEFYDFPPREFEHATLTFELVVSASCFAQLKRHRMATLTWQPYDPALGVMIPPSVAEAGAEREFREVVERTEAAYDVLKKSCGLAAAYVLTNAHRRRVLLRLNVRELYHLSRLREDATAQWDIRAVAARMSALARRVMPLSGLLLGGKDAYPDLYERVFGARPALAPPRFLK